MKRFLVYTLLCSEILKLLLKFLKVKKCLCVGCRKLSPRHRVRESSDLQSGSGNEMNLYNK